MKRLGIGQPSTGPRLGLAPGVELRFTPCPL